jgi:hypothetical protein
MVQDHVAAVTMRADVLMVAVTSTSFQAIVLVIEHVTLMLTGCCTCEHGDVRGESWSAEPLMERTAINCTHNAQSTFVRTSRPTNPFSFNAQLHARTQ